MRNLLFTFILIFACSCQPSQKKVQATDEGLANYLTHFTDASLPLTIKACYETGEGLKLFKEESAKYTHPYSFAYKQIPANGEYIAVITLGMADCLLPTLTTFKPDGEVIAQKSVGIGSCGSDCGFSCEEFMTIRNDYTIYTSDTISVYECDDNGDEIPGTYQYYVLYKEGKLLPDGTIELSDEYKKVLEGRKPE